MGRNAGKQILGEIDALQIFEPVEQPNEKFRGMTNSALARSLCDQGFGYNLTRGCTLKGQEKGFHGVLNVGRVQSAVLGLVNQRTLANQNHTESFYYDVQAALS
ncbi:TPA: DNA topoisomerase, partial [Escherichia coli]